MLITMQTLEELTVPEASAPAPAAEPDALEFFAEWEYRRVLRKARSHPQTHWYYGLVCGWSTGLQLKEVALLPWACVNWAEEYLSVPLNGKDRQIPMDVELYDELKARHESRSPDQPFIARGMAQQYLTDQHRTLSSQFIRLCKSAGLEGKSFNALRRSFIRDLLAVGTGSQLVTEVTGVSDLRKIGRYVASPIATTRKAFHKLSLFRGGFGIIG